MKFQNNNIEQHFSPPIFQFNGHLQTIIPGLFRRIKINGLQRERWVTPDGDFIDVDWLKNSDKRLVILCHGLEGDSRRPYILGMIKALASRNFSTLSWNFRSCSGEINKLKRFYHSGATEDLHFVIHKAIEKLAPEEIFIIGFSLGGNLALKYLGENHNLSPLIKKTVGISVPIHLASSCKKMMNYENRLYEIRFLRSLKGKVISKEKLMPGTFDLKPLTRIHHLWDFDDLYTGPIHGFKDAPDYYEMCSAINFLKDINIPTLLINAKNDPFLSEKCYPDNQQISNPLVTTIYPDKGGHCGFSASNGLYYSEYVTLEFLSKD